VFRLMSVNAPIRTTRVGLAVGVLLVAAGSRGWWQGVSLRETAATLARSGAATGDVRALLAAAQIMITVERASPGLERMADTLGDSLWSAQTVHGGDSSAAGLLRLASRIAVEQQDARSAHLAAELASNRAVGLGDTVLAQQLRQAAGALPTARGAVGGPIWGDGYLGTGRTAAYRITFEGRYRPNTVTVSASSGRGDLDCYLYEGRQLVARDAGDGGYCSIKWSQRIKGRVTLRIRNAGAGTYYTVISN
jgi:hypothetical protein